MRRFASGREPSSSFPIRSMKQKRRCAKAACRTGKKHTRKLHALRTKSASRTLSRAAARAEERCLHPVQKALNGKIAVDPGTKRALIDEPVVDIAQKAKDRLRERLGV